MIQNVQKKFSDKQNDVRLSIMDFIVSEKRPFHLEGDKTHTLDMMHITEEEYDECVKILIKKDGMVIDENKEVNFIYPVSALETAHQVTLADGRSFYAMCAIDALGAAFTFHQDTEIHSSCAVCGEPIHVAVQNGEVTTCKPQGLHALTFPLGELANWAGSC